MTPAPVASQAPGRERAATGIILCADDFAICDGVSSGIEELAAARRLSATGAIVTLPRWPTDGPRLARLADTIAIGLHLNLTLGAPLGAMPHLAPAGRLPPLGQLVRAAMLGRVDAREVAAEAGRQIGHFRAHTGRDPDFIDGHQHAHALPGVRDGVTTALIEAFPHSKPLVRDPADRRSRILARGAASGKSLLIALLSTGFGARLRGAGFPTNDGFSGISAFDRSSPFAAELSRFLSHPGPRHLVMCHPGRADDELARLDPVTSRREDELSAILSYPGLPDLIWHVDRRASPPPGATLLWPGGEAGSWRGP